MANLLRFFNAKDLTKKANHVLQGICMGILANGSVSEQETRFLYNWAQEYKEYFDDMGWLVIDAVTDALEDGKVSKSESAHLKRVLTEFVGDSLYPQQEGMTPSSSLPIDTDAVVTIPDKSFCLTGQFTYGTRDECCELIEGQGGKIMDNITLKTDYLLIGSMVSPFWVNTSYGRKIEKALKNKAKAPQQQIISESMWLLAANG